MDWESLALWLDGDNLICDLDLEKKFLRVELDNGNAIDVEAYHKGVYFTLMEWDETGGLIREEHLEYLINPNTMEVREQVNKLASYYDEG